MKSIAVFNNKGGVGKTTLLCNLAAYLKKEMGKKVLVVDADPQCNTTTYVLNEEQFLEVYYEPTRFTIADLVPPLKKGKGYSTDLATVKSNYFQFDLLPGNPRFAADEDFLSTEWGDVLLGNIRGIKSTMLFFNLLKKYEDYDYVLFDMGPSMGALNRSIILACDFFITPMSGDIFSLLALENIGKSITKWTENFNEGISKLPKQDVDEIEANRHSCEIRFLGYVEQQYITKTENGKARAVHAYEKILSQIPENIQKHIVEPINKDTSGILDYKIGSIPNYHSLVPMSQSSHKPVFDLVSSDGVVGAHYKKVKDYKEIIKSVADSLLHNMEEIR